MGKRRSTKSAERETKVEQAMAAISRGEFSNPYQAAKHFNICYATLKRRVDGGKSVAESREPQQLFTLAEEKALAAWITRLTASGYPVSHSLIEEMAEEIRNRRLIGINDPSIQYVIYEPLGEQWTRRFVERHSHLATAMTRSIELARITEASPEIIQNWYNILFQTIDEYGISPSNTYNCDESGFGVGKSKTRRVVIDTTIKQNYQAEPGRQEWVTVMECISGDGTCIPPLIIFAGENVCTSWIPMKDLPEGWHISCNTKGWTNNLHGVQWLQKCFEPATRDKADNEFRLLICDGHDSHISADFIRHCIANRIVLMLLPPHCSHLMQPLDVGIFFPLKQAIACFLDQIYRTGIARLQKIEWLESFIQAREKALNKQNILGAWRGAGIYPLNPSKVLDKLTSTRKPSPSDSSTILLIATSTEILALPKPFENILTDNSAGIDASTLHSANTALTDLLRINQPLQTPARKFIPRLASTTEWLLAENVILRLELQKSKDMLGTRKARAAGKRLILKGKIVISTVEILTAFEECEAATLAKATKPVGRGRGRPRKIPAVPIVIVEEPKEASDAETDDDPDR
jgi:DDE superfamily endonuclease/Tc5 transposase DNA-binding domain